MNQLSNNEAARLEALCQCQILDTEPEEAFDDLTALAAHICGTPIALVSLIDESRQWFKSKVGLDATQTPREIAFCSHAILQSDVFIVPDTLSDQRFATNPLVTSDPHIRFYAGAPLITPSGYALGTLCVIDRVPRLLDPVQVEALRALSRQVVAQLELRRNLADLVRANTELKQAQEALLRAAVVEATNQKLEKEITSRKRLESQLLHNAFHDVLTGLPNRALFMDRLSRAIARTQRHDEYLFAVLFLDLDRFKLINDSLGHMVGDELLQSIAQRLSGCVRAGDTIARLGGDEFVILLEDIQDLSDATYIAERIQKELTLPFNVCGHEVFTAVSIGIVLSPKTANETESYDQPENLLRDADTAMYRAKALGRARYEVFDTAMHTQSLARLQLETDLRRALERQEFQLHYQPIVSLKTGKLNGFEALVRWQHPRKGLVSPAEFIPVAEETGLIVPIGQWVIAEACKQMSAWQVRFPASRSLTISVNLSAKQFAQPDLIKQIAQILHETNLDAQSLKLEITESVLMEAESVTTVLLQLKALGVSLSIDDFGTGYSSLSYLHRFPIDTLKIDRSFVSRMGNDSENSNIIQAIVTLAHVLDIDVIAEGVETVEQQAQLSALQCKYAQGYLFSKPLDSETAGALIAQNVTMMDNTQFFTLRTPPHHLGKL